MIPNTLCFCIKDNQVLLAMKKRGFGMGKWNGYGGKLKEGETTKSAAVREIEEESGLAVEEGDLEQMAVVRFYFAGEPLIEGSVYVTRIWKGEPVETEEMKPQWFPMEELPFDEMWAGDAEWVPKILKGEKLEADIYFNKEGNVVEKIGYSDPKFI